MQASSQNLVRTRFAPSPTGHLHIGGARTALFNWLYARHMKGNFILRIEDTDEARNSRESVESLLRGLKWLGLDWDEEVHFQSRRKAIYTHYIHSLTKRDRAYEKDGAIWFRMPKESPVIHDIIVGKVIHKVPDDDFVIMRADGKPVFHFVNVIDDLEMRITHIIRGEDHLSNTSKHIALFDALEMPVPHYAHIPLILNSDGSKMSKRDRGSSIDNYMSELYLPDALINYLCLLGWSPKDGTEVLDVERLTSLFDLPQILRHNARFDMEKLRWMNGIYLSKIDHNQYVRLAKKRLLKDGYDLGDFSENYILQSIKTTYGKIRTFDEIKDYAGFYFIGDASVEFDMKDVEKHIIPKSIKGMYKLRESFSYMSSFDANSIQKTFRETADMMHVKLRDLVHPIRVACTGKTRGPSLYDLISILGKDAVLMRIDRAMKKADSAYD